MPYVSRQRSFRILSWSALGLLVTAAAFFIRWEVKSSTLQARFFSSFAQKLSFEVQAGESPSIRYPKKGPYDLRLGYAGLPDFNERLKRQGFAITAQARFSHSLARLFDSGLFTIYHEKTQAGLRVLDRSNRLLFNADYPSRIYPAFESIPPLILDTLLFIENRELLDPRFPHRNPAIEWDRFGRALLDGLKQSLGADVHVAGGSTLATQMEKYRHSPGGRTDSVGEKFRQMGSAALRAYGEGPDTQKTRRAIALDYLNSVPLAGAPGYGEVHGLGDGLRIWYGADLETVSRLLSPHAIASNEPITPAQGQAYRQILSLLLAQRRPAYYLDQGYGDLQALTDRYLIWLSEAGIGSASLRDAALLAPIGLRTSSMPAVATRFLEHKTQAVIRAQLAGLLGIERLYDLDRMDLTARSTLDRTAQQSITQSLANLKHLNYARAAGLIGFRLLSENDDLSKVIYSLTLYERSPLGNLLRIQADNHEQPLDINQGVRLDLGSTAKLRTAVHYLQLIAQLYQRHAGQPPEALTGTALHPRDHLSRWMIDRLKSNPQINLADLLEAALERRYSASPAENFFTGGGLHRFANFNPADNHKVLSVRTALRDSVNLVFIRLMRDILYHYLYRPDGLARRLENAGEPLRHDYLKRFADREGRLFLSRFYAKYRSQEPQKRLVLLTQDLRLTPIRLTTVYRSIYPQHDAAALGIFLNSHLETETLTEEEILRLYHKYSPERFNLQDRGYLARIHPLELWLVSYLMQFPQATLEEVMAASAGHRQEVYGWLFKTSRKRAQDRRIQVLLEIEAFSEIHSAWQRLGYPFATLTPSYACAIGASADRPAALAELMGILLNDGVRYPNVKFDALHFAAGTPYETLLQRQPAQGERVLTPEVAATVRRALIEVVDKGTAVRLRGAYAGPDGKPLVMGGKTGTGDHQRKIYGPNGRLREVQTMNRTASFVFFLGDRFFGTLTAYVAGSDAASYRFTSSLPVQVLKFLAPAIEPLFAREKSHEEGTPKIITTAPQKSLSPTKSAARGYADNGSG